MRVICKTNTTKLVKGATYEVLRLSNRVGNNRASVSIKGLGTYVVKNFTQIDGTPLPNIDWTDPSVQQSQRTNEYIKKPEELKVGEILACRYDSKYLESGKKYKISHVNTIERSYGSGSKYKETKIKVEGFNRWLNPWRFRKLNQEESRDLSLNEIFETPQNFTVDKSIRKIDTMDESRKRKIVLSTLFNSILDPYRNSLSIIDWAVQKTGKKWDLKIEDFKPYLGLTLQEITDQNQ